jgi:AcrR family transcriptional regulator
MASTRDSTATKERIVAAAFDEFARRGFAGSRVDEIADKAQCNKALLYQYFGDKEALFRHILELKMAKLHSIAEDPGQFAETAGEFFDLYAANPWIPRFTMWEALDFDPNNVPNKEERAQHFDEHVDRMKGAQSAGSVDPKLDARQTLISLIGLIQVWFAAPQIAWMVCGGDPYTPQALKTRRAHVVDTARRILEVR